MLYNKLEKKRNWKKIIGIILLATLILSTIYAIIKITNSPSKAIEVNIHTKLKSDYVLMLLQCLVGLFVMMIPSIIQRKFSIVIPNTMEILYFIFLYCAIYLGEVRNFYYLVPHWDTVLHVFSSAMLGTLGFILVNILNNAEQLKFSLSPLFVALFAFCFSLAVGALWEIYEYSFDGLLSLNMQKFALEDGTLLLGRQALADTMKDIMVDALSALITSIIGYKTIKKHALLSSYSDLDNS
ncbi:MAG: hypothetical protein Q8942_09990 [Bacillota bacterium]|nr:hypothetical protein [Bacillota bacterium]